MVDNNAGKGDTYRKVDRKKYEKNYLRIFGELCWLCSGTGYYYEILIDKRIKAVCKLCDGNGYLKKG